MTPTVKDEYVRNLDVVNIASQTDRQDLEKRVEKFKKQIQQAVSSVPKDLCVILTSSATEANCLIVKALC
jgi:hypothetical protein